MLSSAVGYFCQFVERNLLSWQQLDSLEGFPWVLLATMQLMQPSPVLEASFALLGDKRRSVGALSLCYLELFFYKRGDDG